MDRFGIGSDRFRIGYDRLGKVLIGFDSSGYVQKDLNRFGIGL